MGTKIVVVEGLLIHCLKVLPRQFFVFERLLRNKEWSILEI